MPERWTIVVPVKNAAVGKTRLSDALGDASRVVLARAMALDTIRAAATCPAVGALVVMTGDRVVADEAPKPASSDSGGYGPVAPVRVLPEPSHSGARSGLDAAAAAGVAAARNARPAAFVGVLLGDLPALRPDDLRTALSAAETYERAMVADAAGTGTTLLTVAPGVPFESRFGVGSASAHVALGYARLNVPVTSTLRHDVDLPGDLDAIRATSPGPLTSQALEGLPADGVVSGAAGSDTAHEKERHTD